MYEISVIVPVYNRGKSLVQNITSLLEQDLKHIEVVIVNDASNDDTASVINKLANQYSCIKPIHLLKNKGVNEARIEGIKSSTAPWIGFMDADDYVKPNMYDRMLKIAKKRDVDIVVCGTDRVNINREFLSKKLVFKHNELVKTNVFERFCKFEFGTGTLWNKIYKREIIMPLNHMYFPWRQDINEDLILNIGCFIKAKKVYLLKDVLYEYVQNTESATENINKVDAFLEHFRAYALAINAYAKSNENMTIKIAEIYRSQLANYSYPLNDLSELLHNKTKMLEAVDLLYQVNPLAIGLIATSPRPVALGRKEMIKYLAKSLFM